jgi:hypothetical protein
MSLQPQARQTGAIAALTFRKLRVQQAMEFGQGNLLEQSQNELHQQ